VHACGIVLAPARCCPGNQQQRCVRVLGHTAASPAGARAPPPGPAPRWTRQRPPWPRPPAASAASEGWGSTPARTGRAAHAHVARMCGSRAAAIAASCSHCTSLPSVVHAVAAWVMGGLLIVYRGSTSLHSHLVRPVSPRVLKRVLLVLALPHQRRLQAQSSHKAAPAPP
jgi:hypothetical protein